MMRIITGKAKGKRLLTLEGSDTRPTAERAKEAIFSSIQFDIEGRRVLDLFAGSGQMGLEALSRGAGEAMFVDSSLQAMDIVKENAKNTGMFDLSRFLVSDYRNYIRKAAGKESFDLVFIDPPYASNSAADAAERIATAGLCKSGCIVVCESETSVLTDLPSLLEKYREVKTSRYGRAFVTILELRSEEKSDV